jgi:hypothetical protein
MACLFPLRANLGDSAKRFLIEVFNSSHGPLVGNVVYEIDDKHSQDTETDQNEKGPAPSNGQANQEWAAHGVMGIRQIMSEGIGRRLVRATYLGKRRGSDTGLGNHFLSYALQIGRPLGLAERNR